MTTTPTEVKQPPRGRYRLVLRVDPETGEEHAELERSIEAPAPEPEAPRWRFDGYL
jgi:hypothetical protein